ncbi:lamin tail domain-containing protein (plasmid) [Verrucomicrobiaceae bacterium 227]
MFPRLSPKSAHCLLCAGLLARSFANPVEVPYTSDFTNDFGDFYAPTGNGYNWSHNWRTGKYQSWVSSANHTVTATMQARELAAKSFFFKTSIDPVELIGRGHSIGFGACGSTRTFDSYYLADVKPDSSTFRILRISGGNTNIVAEQSIEIDLSDLEPFDLELTGNRTDNSLLLSLTVRRGAESRTISGTDTSALGGSYFGLRGRTNGSGSFENHFDDYELRPLEVAEFTNEPKAFAPVAESYSYVPNGAEANQIPVWAIVLPSGGFQGTPTAADIGQHSVSLTKVAGDHRVELNRVVTVPAPTDVIISEFLADNDDTLPDEDGEASDWIELFNPTANPVDISGWYLSDDSTFPKKWSLPDGTILAPFEFKVIFASAKALPGHANFRLNASAGSYLALHRADNSIASEFTSYPDQQEDISYGVHGDYARIGFLLEPTPGAPNALAGYSGFVNDTKFSVSRGFFDAPFNVEVTCTTPGATIVYTTDGTPPSANNGIPSSSPAQLTISGTTVLRAMAFAPGLAPANIDTQTYLFLSDVRTQDQAHALATGWPGGSVNGQVFNYGMDPEITNSIDEAEFEEAMKEIPTISFVTDIANFTDPLTGFWVNSENRGRGWERPVSVELINPDAAPGFQIDAGVRMRGGFSRLGSNPKHSFHLYFRSEYGTGKLAYPIFGEEGTDTFDALDLRATQGRSWHFSDSPDATFNRDVFARETQRDMGQAYTRSRHYHLYINGQYFGLFQSQERMDADYAASYFGGEKAGYDVIKTRTKPHRVEALDGDPEAWSRLFDAAKAGFSSDAAYYAVQGLDANGDPDPAGEDLVDLDNLIDYMMVIFYTGQTDGPVNLGANVPKNFFAMRPRDGSEGFRFFVHDNEDSFNSTGANSTGDNNTGDRLTYFNPKWLHQQLDNNAIYRQRFGDRVHKHYFNDGALTVARNQARFLGSADPIAKAIIGESARWGDFKVSTPYTRAVWQNAINGKVNSFIPARDGTAMGQLRSRNLYPNITAPNFSQHGGQVPDNFLLSIDAPDGDLYYTIDGSDPSSDGGILLDGAATSETLLAANSPDWSYLVTATPFSDSEVVVGSPGFSSADWKHPDFDDSRWPVGTAPLGYGGVGSPGWTTQIGDGGANPRNRTTYLRKEFTVADAANYIDLKINVRRDDGAIVYLNGREIARSNMPSGNVTYGDTASSNASGASETEYFSNTYPLSPGVLLEGRNILAVEIHQDGDSSSDLVIDVEVLGTNAAGSGVAITTNTVVKARALEGGQWSALNEARFFTTVPASSLNLVISEIYYNPPGPDEGSEYLELRNISTVDRIHLDGLSFSEGISFSFPADLTLAPGETLLLVKNLAAFEMVFGAGLPVVGEFGGSLANGGEEISLPGIVTFSYEDTFPWSTAADGDGRSLVFLGGDPALAGSWRSSAAPGGSPGGSDATRFNGGDFENYAFGGFTGSLESPITFSFPHNLAADDVTYILESSTDLQNWGPASGWSPVGEILLVGAYSRTIWQRNNLGSREFLRMAAKKL